MYSFGNIPHELRELRQWINWRYEKRNDNVNKVPLQPVNGYSASVTNTLHWNSFDVAFDCLQYCDGLGFVFTASDNFCGIDLDSCEGDDRIIASHNDVYAKFVSYSEKSPSGKGLHIICKGVLPYPGAGRRRDKIEVYDRERFFTFTGNVVANRFTINDCQRQLIELYDSLGKRDFTTVNFNLNMEQTQDDAAIYAVAANATNGEKFRRLYAGDWRTDYWHKANQTNTHSSEADFALINILSFYSRNKQQIARMFAASGLAQRDKAKRVKYVDDMINRSFDRMPPKADLDQLYNQRMEILARLKVD